MAHVRMALFLNLTSFFPSLPWSTLALVRSHKVCVTPYNIIGRYGDPLNPWGDIIAIAQAWCVSTPDVSLFLKFKLSHIFFGKFLSKHCHKTSTKCSKTDKSHWWRRPRKKFWAFCDVIVVSMPLMGLVTKVQQTWDMLTLFGGKIWKDDVQCFYKTMQPWGFLMNLVSRLYDASFHRKP